MIGLDGYRAKSPGREVGQGRRGEMWKKGVGWGNGKERGGNAKARVSQVTLIGRQVIEESSFIYLSGRSKVICFALLVTRIDPRVLTCKGEVTLVYIWFIQGVPYPPPSFTAWGDLSELFS